MKIGLHTESAEQYARESGLILDGYTVSPDHSILLCEQGKEWFYSRKRVEQRESIGQEYQGKKRTR